MNRSRSFRSGCSSHHACHRDFQIYGDPSGQGHVLQQAQLITAFEIAERALNDFLDGAPVDSTLILGELKKTSSFADPSS